MTDISLFAHARNATMEVVVDDSDVIAHLQDAYPGFGDRVVFHILKNPSLKFYHEFITAATTQDFAKLEELVYEAVVDSAGKRKIAAGDTLDRTLVDAISVKIFYHLVKPARLTSTPTTPVQK